MPWTINDVDKFKKGLTPKLKKQWVRIANSVLNAELKKGLSEKEAAAAAIQQASGVVINNNVDKYSVYKNKQTLAYDVKLTVHQDKAHLIAPVVMMVEGVHNGNQGPLFHSINELGKFPDSWNGIPVVIYHPEMDGQSISANSPDVIDKMTVGRVYNTEVEGTKLKAEVWLDEDRLNTVSETTLADINAMKQIEVSLGMFTENEMTPGKYNEEEYVGVAKSHRPDHLAILPDQVGACSCEDGCGLGANKEMNKQSCEVNSGNVDFAGESIDIHKKVEYVVNSGLTRNNFSTNNKKEDKNMSKNECPKCAEKINALIANTASGFVEGDREWLDTLSEAALDKVAPKVIEKEVVKTIEVNKLSPADQKVLDFGRKQLEDRRNGWIAGIQANAKDIWAEEKLMKMDDDILEGIYKSVKKEETVDYSLNGSSVIQANAGGEEPMSFNGVDLK